MDSGLWDSVQRIRKWLDDNVDEATAGDPCMVRVLKIGEEYGEAAQALIGAVGANPRKAQGSWDNVRTELADVIVTAAVALATCAPNPEQVLEDRMAELMNRLPQT